jgi:site-specific DNA-adenine methylase
MINSPIKWVGGKSRLRKQIIELLPPHTCYVELFSGAAWVYLEKHLVGRSARKKPLLSLKEWL